MINNFQLEIKNKLNEYLKDCISLNDLSEWAVKVLHSVLNDKIYDLNIINYYSFISELTSAEDFSKSYINLIHNKLSSGTFSNVIVMKIQTFVADNEFEKAREILNNYKNNKNINLFEYNMIKSFVEKNKLIIPKTIMDIIYKQICMLLQDCLFADNNIIFNTNSIFIKEHEVPEEKLLNNILSLFDCYFGESPFQLLIYSNENKFNYSILPLNK